MNRIAEFAKQPAARVVGELVFIAVVVGTWVLTYLSLEGSLDDLSPAGRALYLQHWFTDESLPIAFWGVLALCLVLPLRHVRPFATLVLVSVVVPFAQWQYPLFAQNSIVLRLALGLTAFWATWRIKNWWWTIPLMIPSIAVTGYRAFQINERIETINTAPGSTTISISTTFQEVLFYSLAIGAGLIARLLLAQSGELAERNLELEHERALTAETAVIDERLRISRELHDVVAHHVTTMTVHAGAARQMLRTSPDNAEESLRHIESAGRSAVNELHQMLGFLRDSGDGAADDSSAAGGRAPTPSLRHLDTLKGQFGDTLTCDVSIDGDIDSIPAAVDLSAYRIIQEALTNAVKHSTATAATVSISVDTDRVGVEVLDHGRTSNSTSATGGHGIVGMKERATLHGGSVEIGPLSTNGSGPSGWRVHALLPFGPQR